MKISAFNKILRRVFSAVCLLQVVCLLLTGCAFAGGDPDTELFLAKSQELTEGDFPTVREDVAPDSMLFSYHFFIEPDDAVESAEILYPADPYGNIPFFVGILKTSSASDAARLSGIIYENLDYNKLVCAPYEKAFCENSGSVVVLIMDIEPERAQSILNAFQEIAGKK